MQEEVENRAVNLAISTTRLTARAILSGVAKYNRYRSQKKANKAAAKKNPENRVIGKQTVKELIGQNQGVTSLDIAKTDMRGFQKYARKYGVDYAITKDKSGMIPKYLVFFKARDADALNACMRAYSADVLRRQDRPSALKQLARLKAVVKALPTKVRAKTPGVPDR